MNRFFWIIVFSCCAVEFGFSQEPDFVTGTYFIKRVEPNYRSNLIKISGNRQEGSYNFDSKTEVEKLFFGDMNAKVEFFISMAFEGESGFRVVRDGQNPSWRLEIKYIPNWKEVENQLDEEFPLQAIFLMTPQTDTMSEATKERIGQHNRAMLFRQDEERPKRQKVKNLLVPISDSLADTLYSKFMSSIDRYKGKGRPGKMLDGETATWRCVVEDDLWTLTIEGPRDDMGKLSDLCVQIIADVKTGKFDEAKYIKQLSNIK